MAILAQKRARRIAWLLILLLFLYAGISVLFPWVLVFPMHLSLDTIPIQGNMTVSRSIYNLGMRSINISHIRTTCGCIKVWESNIMLNRWSKQQLTISVHPTSAKYNSTIKLFTNREELPIEIGVRGKAYKIYNADIAVGKKYWESIKPVSVPFDGSKLTNFQITSVTTTSLFPNIQIYKDAEESASILIFQPNFSQEDVGDFSEQFAISTNEPLFPVFPLTIKGTALRSIFTAPESVSLGILQEHPIKKTCTLASSRGRPFTILSIVSDSAQITCGKWSGKPAVTHSFEITWEPKGKIRDIDALITIYTDDDKTSLTQLPVYGIVQK